MVLGTLEATSMLRGRDPQPIVLTDGALETETKADKPTVNLLKRVGINLAALPNEALYLFQNGMIAELQAREQHALQVISE